MIPNLRPNPLMRSLSVVLLMCAALDPASAATAAVTTAQRSSLPTEFPAAQPAPLRPTVDDEGYPVPATRPIPVQPRPNVEAPVSSPPPPPPPPPPSASPALDTSVVPARPKPADARPVRPVEAPPTARPKPEQPVPTPRAPPVEVSVLAAGKVITMEGPRQRYVVRKGEGLDAIADRLGSDRATLAKLNKLKAPYRVRAGQALVGLPTSMKAYVVDSGDTLAVISQRFNVKVEAFEKANRLKRGAPLRAGRKLLLPTGAKDRGPIRRTTSAAAPTVTIPPLAGPPAATSVGPVSPTPYRPSTPAPGPYRPAAPAPGRTGSIVEAAPPPTDAQIAALGAGRFIWPLRGTLLSSYGPKGGGQRNDGVDIGAPTGTPVRAAADGEVVYAGDLVPGFGNLVLVKHTDGWVTAYAHLSKASVTMRQRISQGEQVGLVGSSGGVSEPQLHFEVRYSPSPREKARAIDPALVLPHQP